MLSGRVNLAPQRALRSTLRLATIASVLRIWSFERTSRSQLSVPSRCTTNFRSRILHTYIYPSTREFIVRYCPQLFRCLVWSSDASTWETWFPFAFVLILIKYAFPEWVCKARISAYTHSIFERVEIIQFDVFIYRFVDWLCLRRRISQCLISIYAQPSAKRTQILWRGIILGYRVQPLSHTLTNHSTQHTTLCRKDISAKIKSYV